LLLIPLLLLACSNDGAARAPSDRLQLNVGIVQSLTGAGGVYGQTVVQGMQLAIEEINASSSSGVHIDYFVADDRSTIEDGRAAYEDFIGQNATAILGPTLSSVAFETLKLAQAASIPAISPTTTALGITDAGDYVFRVALAEDMVVPNTLAHVAKQTPLRNAVLFLDSSDAFSVGSAAAMRKGINAINGAVVAEIDISRETNVPAVLDGLRRGTVLVDAFLVTPLVDQSAKIVTAIRDAGFSQPIVGGNSFNTLDIARLTGSAIEGAYVGAAWNPTLTSSRSRSFVDAYSRAYGGPPDQFAAQGYTSVYILADAVRRARSADAVTLRDALAATQDLDTPLGSLSMSSNRDAVHLPVVQRYVNGQLTVIQ
jgi:branched-chain amino acid transport system substrate-binding protein